MSKIILIYGLLGSGKTTLSNKIFQKLESSEHLNGDQLITKYKDWDFSEKGRMRQTKRMIKIAKKSTKQWVILDFVCPLKIYRKLINPEIKIFMNTINEGRF